MTNKKETKEVVIAPKKELVLEGDPEQQLAFAIKAANALMKAIEQKPKKVMIRGEQYLEYGDWQTLARFFGATASVAWTKPVYTPEGTLKPVLRGYEARAEVLHNGMVISSAEAMCTREESNWKSRDEFMLRSMAQTRAAAKALRNAYGWVAELAGLKSTPAEEMGEQYDTSKVKDDIEPVVYIDDHEIEVPKKIEKPKILTKVEEQKREIKKTIDAKVLAPLEQTETAYKEYVKNATGLELEAWNYPQIIERLKSI